MKLNHLILFIIVFFLSCDNKKELTEQVKESISKDLSVKNLKILDLYTEIISLDLVGKGNNEFIGILTTKETRKKDSKLYNKKDTMFNSILFEYEIHVISDGDKFMYV